MSGPSDDGKVVAFDGSPLRNYEDEHELFLDDVKRGISGRPVSSVVVLVLDKAGAFTYHASTGDIDRTLAMTTLALDYCKRSWLMALEDMEAAAESATGEENDEEGPDTGSDK